VELSGTYDFMFEAAVADMAEYRMQLSLCAGAVAKFASRYEANFYCKRFVRADAAERAIWVPSEDGLMRLDCSDIDKVTAQGDYMLVHSSGRSWMLHTTMQEIEEKLGSEDFIRVHRSTIVRHGFVERLRHEGRIWTARLNDGSVERISNSYVVEVLAKLRTKSSASRRTPSKRARPAEAAADAQRMIQAQSRAA
jgi:DNA-binding LytR/AlgR family response regulator